MTGPRASRSLQARSGELEPWVARHLADAAALLSPQEEAVVVYVPPGLGDEAAITAWAEPRGLLAEFVVVEGEEGQEAGLLVRLSAAPALDDPP